MVFRSNEREVLAWEIERDEYRELLRGLQKDNPFLRDFHTWGEVISFMREGSSADPRKDEVLRPIFRALSADQSRYWHTIILAIFYPGLDSVFNRKRSWDAEEDHLWQNVQWAFLQAVCKLDISRRTDRLVQRIVNGTIHRLHDEYLRVWKHAERETATDPEQFEELIDGGEELDIDEMDRRSRPDAEIRRLREQMEAGRISEADFLLLVGTRVYGKTAAQYGRETGMSCELARKRRLRAEAAIRGRDKGK